MRFFLNENEWISRRISLKFVPKVRINNIPSLVQIMAWRRPGDKPLSEPMLVCLPPHICVTRPQWVNMKRLEDGNTKCLRYWNLTNVWEETGKWFTPKYFGTKTHLYIYAWNSPAKYPSWEYKLDDDINFHWILAKNVQGQRYTLEMCNCGH